MLNDQSHWTDEDRNTRPEACHLCHTGGVPLTNYSRHYGGYQGPHWLCALCEHTQAASRQGAGGYDEWQTIVGDVAALLHAALEPMTQLQEIYIAHTENLIQRMAEVELGEENMWDVIGDQPIVFWQCPDHPDAGVEWNTYSVGMVPICLECHKTGAPQ